MIDTVQTIVDPVQNQGKGIGIAPIGHIVSVEGVSKQNINIEISLTTSNNITFTDLKSSIEKIIDDYFFELNKSWEENDNLIVRVSQIETRILTLPNVIDIQNTKINGVAGNLSLDPNAIAVRGVVSG